MKKTLLYSLLITLILLNVQQASACTVFLKEVKLGNSGADVVSLQTHLEEKGFPIPSVSSGATKKGYFGAQSVTALKKYQKSLGLAQTGKLDVATRKKINQSCSIQTQKTAPVKNTETSKLITDLKLSSNTIKVGETHTLTWKYNGAANDTRAYYVYAISDSLNGGTGEIGFISNIKSGLYNWTVPPSLFARVDQKVKFIISTKAPNVLTPITPQEILASTDYVQLIVPNLTASLKLTAPGEGDKITIGQPFSFTWQSENIPIGSEISIILVDEKLTETVLNTEVNATGLMKISIPYTVKPGFYTVKMSVKFPNSKENYDIRHSGYFPIEFVLPGQKSKTSILEFSDRSLDDTMYVNQNYVRLVSVSGNSGQVTFSQTSGFIDGVSIQGTNDSSLLIVGTPKTQGTYSITIKATDTVSGKTGTISGKIYVYR